MTKKEARRRSRVYIKRSERVYKKASQSLEWNMKYGDPSKRIGWRLEDHKYQVESWTLLCKASEYAFRSKGLKPLVIETS